MNILRERMRRVSYMGTTIRLWIMDDGQPEGFFDGVAWNAKCMAAGFFNKDLPCDAEAVLKISNNINAVEVLDDEGNGVVLYRDWP